VSDDLRGDEIYTWGFPGRVMTDYISDISRCNRSWREGEWEGGGEEIVYICGVVWIENIGMRLKRGVEVRGEFFGFVLVRTGPRNITFS
jgi:hypothetical protein